MLNELLAKSKRKKYEELINARKYECVKNVEKKIKKEK
jgi:hypothetical protein